jgi:hypothetical protein
VDTGRWVCLRCFTSADASATQCPNCGLPRGQSTAPPGVASDAVSGSQASPVPETQPDDSSPRPLPKRRLAIWALLGVVGLLALVGGVQRFAESAGSPGSDGFTHEAPELEALLPSMVDGRQLTVWSVVGHTWLATGSSDDVAAFETAYLDAGHDLDHLRFAIAGRSDTSTDPPYFVFATWQPADDEEADVALALLARSAGIDPNQLYDGTLWRDMSIGGQAVLVGTEGMIEQTEHVRGQPYVYETAEYVFIVVTDDEGWAEDAISQLPGG